MVTNERHVQYSTRKTLFWVHVTEDFSDIVRDRCSCLWNSRKAKKQEPLKLRLGEIAL